MANDIATTSDGDLDLDNGVAIALPRYRDRNLVITRLMTIQGEVENLPQLGISDRLIGKPVENSSLSALVRDMRRALSIDIGLRDLNATVKALPVRRDTILGLVQPKKAYGDDEESSTIVGDFWTRDENITLLDGSEG